MLSKSNLLFINIIFLHVISEVGRVNELTILKRTGNLRHAKTWTQKRHVKARVQTI